MVTSPILFVDGPEFGMRLPSWFLSFAMLLSIDDDDDDDDEAKPDRTLNMPFLKKYRLTAHFNKR